MFNVVSSISVFYSASGQTVCCKKKKKSCQTNLLKFDLNNNWRPQSYPPLACTLPKGLIQILQHELKHLCGCTINSVNVNLVPRYMRVILLNKCIACSPHTLSDCSNLLSYWCFQYWPNLSFSCRPEERKYHDVRYEFTFFLTDNPSLRK